MIVYHFTGSHINGLFLTVHVLEIVQACENINLKISVVTCDMGASNPALWRELGFSNHRHSNTVCWVQRHFLEGKELFFTADSAHVLKDIRGQLLSSDVFTLSDVSVCQHGLPSNQVKLDYVHVVIEYDAERELKVGPRHSEVHVSGGHFTKIKVGIAVQLFRETPAAIRYLIKEILEPKAETTAWFLEGGTH